MKTIPDRLEALRDLMRREGLTHYLVPSADENVNEYLPAWRQRREWASGFTGSAGDLLVGAAPDETFLFTDGRYHLQAERELSGSGIALEKVGAKGARTLVKMLAELAERAGARCVVGCDLMVLPESTARALAEALEKHGGALRASPNLVDEIWRDRPEPPATELLACPVEWTGASTTEKIAALRADLESQGAGAFVAIRLDQIAWLLNLRSLDDIPFNPVFESSLYVDRKSVLLFLNGGARRLPAGYATTVPGLEVRELARFPDFLKNLSGVKVQADPERVTAGVIAAICAGGKAEVIQGVSPVESRKAEKNATELARMRHANLMASVAKTRALLWLEGEVAAGRSVTERGFKERIEALYAEIDGYRGPSFETIAAAGAHGAIIHYGGADDTRLAPGDLFLIDSGIQMDGGTTDDTRTVAVGRGSEEQVRIYTLVLAAHAAGASQVFPEGTSGAALDSIVRAPLWAEGLNYDHGTGHGVGAFLNVHEGPFGIAERARRSYAALPLKPGMVTSIEPGFYRAGFGGVRLENLYEVRPADGAGAGWLEFAPLTFVPFDRRLVAADRLGPRERVWLERYHAECARRLAPHLAPDERRGLARLLDAGEGHTAPAAPTAPTAPAG